MLKRNIFLLAFIALSANTMAQTAKPVKFKDTVFPNITKTTDLSYSPNDSKERKKSHLFDLYEPAGDNSKGRPLIIWMHGGGFKFGSKTSAGVKLWSESFAKRGYVCVSINYTLSKGYPFLHFDELLKSTYYAVQDARAAVAYFRKNYKQFNIDPEKIILGGNSAGGMIALQAAYSSDLELSKFAAIPDSLVISRSTTIPKVAGVINYWGGIFNPEWLKNSRVPIVCVHGSTDSLVPLTHKDAPLYGSLSIHERADELHIPNGFKLFEGYSHELQKHFNPVFGAGKGTKERWREAADYTAGFLLKNVVDK